MLFYIYLKADKWYHTVHIYLQFSFGPTLALRVNHDIVCETMFDSMLYIVHRVTTVVSTVDKHIGHL